MRIFQNLSIRNKLVGMILSVTILALGIGFTLVIISNVKLFKADMKNNTIATAQVIGDYCVSPLVFSDSAGAEQILAKLAAVPSIVNAILYDTNGEMFATFASSQESVITPPKVREPSSEYVENYLHVYQPILYKDEYYGTIYLRTSTKSLNAKIINYLRHMVLLMVGLIIVSIILAIWFQRIISQPILNLAGVAQQISKEGNYSIRVQKRGNDETGLLYDGFNDMLQQIQNREIERDRAEFALRESENKFRTLTSNIPGAIYRCAHDPNWTLDFISDVIEEISGYQASDFIQNRVRTFTSIIHPEDRKIAKETVHEGISQRAPYQTEYRIVRSDGVVRWVNEKGQGIFSKDNQLLWLDGAIFDITERKRVEEELARHKEHLEELVETRTAELINANKQLQQEITDRKHAEEALQALSSRNEAILSAVPDIIMEVDGNKVYTWANQAGFEFFGDDVLGKEAAFYFEGAQETYDRVQPLFNGDENVIYVETYQRRKDGEKRLLAWWCRVLKDTKGNIIGALSTARDITERKKAEMVIATRLRYEEGLAACSRTLLTGTETEDDLSVALEYLLNAANASRVYIFENFEDEIDGLCMRQVHEACANGVESQIDNPILQHAPYKEGFERWKEILSKGEPIQGRVETFPIIEREILESQDILSMLVIPITVDEEWYGFIGFDDVWEKREWSDEDIRSLRTASEMIGIYIETIKFEQALRVSEERFRSLVENASDVIYSLNPEGEFSYISPKVTEITGHNISDLLGKTFFTFLHPEDTNLSGEWFQTVLKRSRKPGSYEFRLIHKNGSIRWFVAHSSIIHDEKGNVLEVIGVAHDITEMKKVLNDLEKANKHLRETQTQLVQSAKMASLGQLVAGIAHEINTPIGAVNSMQDTLFRTVDRIRTVIETHFPEEYEAQHKLNMGLKIIDDSKKVINSGTERVINIVKRLRSFARLDEAELKTVDIHEGLEDTLTLIHHEIKHNITVIKNYGDVPPVACYPGRLNQVFLNILINAKHAIKDKGTISITTRTKDNNIQIAIKDTGIGIAKKHLKKIFDPGFTTKGVGVGTGLGLSICYQIIQDHMGEILVESEVGKGTTFTVVLPMHLDVSINSM